MATAFSCYTFRKTHKDYSHTLLNVEIFGAAGGIFFLIENKEEISDRSVTLAFDNVTLGRKKERKNQLCWLSPPKIINTTSQSNR